MKLLVSGSTRLVARAATRYGYNLGILTTPSNRNSVKTIVQTGLPWAVDNGAFSGFDAERFRRLLRRVSGQPRLLWVACPDVVGDAKRTLELFGLWGPELVAAGVPVAFIGQDGQEDLSLPLWDEFCAFFVGGTTRWKLSQAAADLARECKSRGKLLHMGRVNSRRRIQAAFDLGCDSVDGSSASMFGDKYIWKHCRWIKQMQAQSGLFA